MLGKTKSAKMHLVLVFLVSLKRKNILFAKMHFCTQNVRKNKNAFYFNRENVFVRFVLQNVKIQNGSATKQRFVSKISVLCKKRVK